VRLKEIKPGMEIHCNSIDEYNRLEEETKKLGFGELPLRQCLSYGKVNDRVFVIQQHGYRVLWKNYRNDREYTEFSDLIIPELTAEEVLSTISEIHKASYGKIDGCIGCPLKRAAQNCETYCFKENADKIIEICQQWKSAHESKEPEIETVDICRIIKVLPDGCKRCVHEEDINPDPDLPYGGEQIAVEQILKRYCMEHDGEFIAVHEVVSRVKAVE
jgi:hypothetical protein